MRHPCFITYLANPLNSVAVEAAPKGGRGRARVKQGAKDHAGDVAGGIATGAGFIPSTAGK
jgi:hypothetical protein